MTKELPTKYYRDITLKIAAICLLHALGGITADEAMEKICKIYEDATKEADEHATEQDAKPTGTDAAERMAGDGQDGSTGGAGERRLEGEAA